jgi:hypothetical protein
LSCSFNRPNTARNCLRFCSNRSLGIYPHASCVLLRGIEMQLI